jgi:hypothetical protein
MNKTYLKAVAATVVALCSTACNSYNEPKTSGEWKAFCEAPDSDARIKAISDEAKRQKAAGVCLHAPWQKFEPSKPRTW